MACRQRCKTEVTLSTRNRVESALTPMKQHKTDLTDEPLQVNS